MTALTDLIKLANINGGKIPATIPAHYVQWAAGKHKASRQASRDAFKAGCVDSALTHLRGLVASGVEYPDAEFKTTRRFKVDACELRAAYDNLH